MQVFILVGGMKALFCLSTIAIISAAYAEADRPIGHIDLRLTKAAETESAPVKNMLANKPSPLPTFVSSKQTVETEQERTARLERERLERERLEKESNVGANLLFSLEDKVLKPVVGINYNFPGKLLLPETLRRIFQLSEGYLKLTVVNVVGTATTEGQSSGGLGIGITSAVSESIKYTTEGSKGTEVQKSVTKTASFFIGAYAPNYNISKTTLLIGFKF
jgi:hypothetical protein